ncbi:MAG TPA: fused MFS/spermidine synthase [Acidobacteriaceae bacterium]|nr:fused MFS/spermidine synthase [Acidobacteriaceae bacterium]
MSLVRWLYALTISLSAFLLFLVEPMVAKQLLPAFGGSSAVWTSCLVFFQLVLLFGYLYAHWLSSKLSPARQADVHVLLLIAALLMLGVQLKPHAASASYHPALTVFWILTAVIGVPCLALSATTPLMTAWFAQSFPGERPYRLFSLSNFASLLALVCYPIVLEPHMTMHQQTSLWTPAFFLFAVSCGAIAWAGRSRTMVESPAVAQALAPGTAAQQASPASRLNGPAMWLILAMGGGMMLTAVTNHLSQNIAAIPLLWLPPLALYLTTFILVFQGSWYVRSVVLRAALLALALMGYALLDIRKLFPIEISLPLFLIGLFVVCWFLHGELYTRRPGPESLTRFYLCTAAGGAAGTMLVGVVAPLVLDANYDLACTLLVVALIGVAASWKDGWGPRLIWAAGTVGAIVVVHAQVQQYNEDAVALVRNFYGTLRVRESNLPPQADTDRQLLNGTIEHGAEWFAPEYRDQPLTYYAPHSGVGLAMRLCCGTAAKRVGVIGLGTGTLAAYGNPGDVIRFYEINPLVERLARSWFTYLRDSKADTSVTLGDARVSMSAQSPQHFNVIAVDAFSGDAIPVHLLTKEALALYRRHLQPDGIIAFHVSNRFIDLEPVVAAIARDAGLEAVAIDTHADEQNGFYSTDWVLVTANQAFLRLPEMAGAIPLSRRTDLKTWTDSYSSVFPLLKWRTQ